MPLLSSGRSKELLDLFGLFELETMIPYVARNRWTGPECFRGSSPTLLVLFVCTVCSPQKRRLVPCPADPVEVHPCRASLRLVQHIFSSVPGDLVNSFPCDYMTLFWSWVLSLADAFRCVLASAGQVLSPGWLLYLFMVSRCARQCRAFCVSRPSSRALS